MYRALLAAVVALAAPAALAQADGGVEPPPDLEAKLEAARREVKELREEMRAQLATQSIAQGWQEDWVEEKRKLELVTFDGYLRVRPELFHKFDLGRPADPAGYTLWPVSPLSSAEKTNAGVNMRFRFEPTINVSEEVRVRAQLDALDNVLWGSTPDYAFSRNGVNGYWYDRNDLSVFSMSQAPVRSGINSLQDSLAVKRVWGEISTPVGLLRFGRMGSHWGLGMLHNDGNGLDNDWGDTVDRVMFVAEPINGYYVTPMLDFNAEGLTSVRLPEGGQPFDLSNSDESHSFILAVAKRDTDTEARARLDAGQTVFNYGLHFTYRVQRNEVAGPMSTAFGNEGEASGSRDPNAAWGIERHAYLFMPDLWAKLERKNWRLEAEAAAVLGFMKPFTAPTDERTVELWQFGAVVQGEYKFLNGDLEVGGEVGFASGDDATGFGNYPRRNVAVETDGTVKPGHIDGAQWRCSSTADCPDRVIRNFRFNRDYRVDMILYREILGGVTDSFYVKPRVSYRVTQGFNVFGSALYARAIWASSTPSAVDVGRAVADLGVELNAGARYETEDGFFGQLQYGVLFPMGGFGKLDPVANQPIALDTPMALRATLGIKF